MRPCTENVLVPAERARPGAGREDLRRRALASRVSTGAPARGPGFPGAGTPVTAAPATLGGWPALR